MVESRIGGAKPGAVARADGPADQDLGRHGKTVETIGAHGQQVHQDGVGREQDVALAAPRRR